MSVKTYPFFILLLLIFSNANGKLMEGFPPLPNQQVTDENWLKPPYNRWSFQHVRRLSPTAQIRKGENPATPLERAEKDLLSLKFSLPTGRAISIKEMLENTHTDGFLVLHHGKIITEHYYHSMKPDTKHIVWSCSKSILGTLAGILVDQGLLSPKSPVTEYIPELSNTAFADATIREILDMTVAMEKNADKKFCSLSNPKTPSVYKFVQSIAKDGEHGGVFFYANPTAIVLGWVLERCSNTYLPDLVSQLIWQPLGAEEDANTVLDSVGSAQPSCGFSITLRDMGRFGQMMLQNGFYAGKQIVPREWIKDTRFRGNKEVFKQSFIGQLIPGGSYRNMWWVGNSGALMAMGVYGQLIYIDYDADLVIVKLSSQPTPSEISMQLLTHQGVLAIVNHIKNSSNFRHP